ncbi:uncharacterized protein HMPREF1541_01170 [Cyphellophora europaea CBS 101466]|uniref:Uncharacterized protein n=1 Tax=Cyphellophora europaea (strain CBS 101466) TaxID=1220924 RepID=W2SED4_CYPE1|nr:uncharacterized protein HMPREF1541_01170 [Cyphellophora europaea CBS 101466]ETN46980.1 hypothetical protein HMPREF1541_01170 [Cyphellophora europaea CBS 101466]
MAYTTAYQYQGSQTYVLRCFSWRSILGIVGPLALFCFYAFICFYFLNRKPENDILPASSIDADVPFYLYFIVSIFTLEWARTALSNFQAAALMRPSYGPTNAMGLMWHADDNWANPLWWLRALRNLVYTRLSRPGVRGMGSNRNYRTTPGLLWVFLSFTSMLIFVAIPLSGLTLEFTPALKTGRRQATILGPTAKTVNMKARNSLPSIIEGSWKTGDLATPPDSSYFFAPDGSHNVSLTYLEDMSILNPNEGFTTFLGPAIKDLVSGTTFGLEASLRCQHVDERALRLTDSHEWDLYNLTYTLDGSVSSTVGSGAEVERYGIVFLNETRSADLQSPYSLMIAADGTWYGNSPYVDPDNIDRQLYSYAVDNGTSDGTPSGLLEMYLWQAGDKSNDTVWKTLQADPSPLLAKATLPSQSQVDEDMGLVGYAIQCHVRSRVGHARLDPMKRTYSDFKITNTTGNGGDNDVYGLQMLSIMALSDWDGVNYRPRQVSLAGFESRWVSLHQGLGQPASEICISECDNPADENYGTGVRYLALTPTDATRALYRLLGQSMIAIMSAGSQDPWKDDLFLLDSARWLKPGPMPWKPVLAILALWTAITISLSIWTLTTKRWAPTMSGFELFRFGGQFADEINGFDSGRFEACDELRKIPGLVGVLPGLAADGEAGFIGLSESPAHRDGRYVYDRRRAARYRRL